MTDMKSAEKSVPVDKSWHSPGPWQMATSCSFRRIIDARGREIIGGTVQRSDNHPDMHFANGGFEGPDAKLVLAAPDLLEALDELLNYRGGADSALDDEYVMDRARAALSRARGEVQS